MGNCCTSEDKMTQNENYTMQGPAKKKLARGQATESGDHAPILSGAITQVKEMNELNPEVQKQVEGLEPFEAESNEDFSDLPTMGPFKYEDGSTFQGQYCQGQRCGNGKCVWPEGFYYDGYWYNDMRNGKGRLIHEEGDVYEGDWVDGKAEGYGEYKHTDGTCYKGDWKNDQQEGHGREVWDDGSVYEGEYKAGMKNGKGKFVWVDKSSYEGDFVDNNLEGIGKLYYDISNFLFGFKNRVGKKLTLFTYTLQL